MLDAISLGYRLIDTAQAYYNEEGVGNAVAKCGVPRNELFLTTKVWITNAGEEKAARSIDESLRKLRTDYNPELVKFLWNYDKEFNPIHYTISVCYKIIYIIAHLTILFSGITFNVTTHHI